MAELTLGLLKLALMLFALALLPISLIVSTPVILLWPVPAGELSWGQVVRARYWRVTKSVWMIAEVCNAITGG